MAKIRIIQKVFVNFHQLIRLVNNNCSSYHVRYSERIISFNFILTNFLSYSPQVLFDSSKYLEICIFHHILNSQMEIIICLQCVLIQEVRFVKITSWQHLLDIFWELAHQLLEERQLINPWNHVRWWKIFDFLLFVWTVLSSIIFIEYVIIVFMHYIA